MPSFHDIIGQDRPRTILQTMLRTRNIPPLLFSGEDGIGKRTLAVLFAQTLLCREPQQEEEGMEPCNHCLSCEKMKIGNHPEWLIVEPIESETIKIDQIRELQSRLTFGPIESAWKVILIVPAEKMTQEAQNSLLKTLEEPPAYAVFILISAMPSLLVPTILSRCQKVAFAALSFSQIEAILVERRGWTAGEARLVSALTGGRLGEALSLSVEEARHREEALYRMVHTETLAHYETLFETAILFSKETETFTRALYYLAAYLRDILVLLAVPNPAQLDPAYLVFSWRKDALLEGSRRMNTFTTTKMIADITVLQQSLVRNINRQLALETLLMQMRDHLQSNA